MKSGRCLTIPNFIYLYISLIGLICVSCRFSTRRISGRQRNLPRRPRERALIGRKARAIGGSSPTQNSPLRFLIGILYHEGFFFSIVKLPGNPFLRRGNPPLQSPRGKEEPLLPCTLSCRQKIFQEGLTQRQNGAIVQILTQCQFSAISPLRPISVFPSPPQRRQTGGRIRGGAVLKRRALL